MKTKLKKLSKILKIIFVFFCLGVSGRFLTTIIHESGHLAGAKICGATKTSMEIHIFKESYAQWTGARCAFATFNGSLLLILVGLLPLCLILIKKIYNKQILVIKLFLVTLAIYALPTSFLYMGYGVLLKWGDGYKLVNAYNWPSQFMIFGNTFLASFSYLLIYSTLHKVFIQYVNNKFLIRLYIAPIVLILTLVLSKLIYLNFYTLVATTYLILNLMYTLIYNNHYAKK